MSDILKPKLGSQDMLCFDFVGDTIRAVREKTYGSKRLIAEVFSKDVKGLGRDDVVKTLKEILAAVRRRGDCRVVLSIPTNLVITKNIEIPSQDPKEIRDIINLQAGRLTPYSRDEVIIDYINIGVFRQSYTKLLLVIVKKDIINKQLMLFADAGARINRIFLAPEAIGALVYQHFRLEVQEMPYVLVHADAATTDFGIFIKGKQIFSRSIAIGATGLIHDKEKILARFIEELKKSLDAYQVEDIETTPVLVVFCGAVEHLPDLEVMMLDGLRIPVRILVSGDWLPRADSLGAHQMGFPEASVLSAAAPTLIISPAPHINLIPEEIKMRLALEERGREMVKFGILVMTLLLFLCASFLAQIYLKTEFLHKLNARFKTLNADAAEIESDFSRLRMVRSFLQSRGLSLNVLAETYELTPQEIALNNIRFKENGSFSVRGEAFSMGAVFAYVGNLERSNFFKEVKTKYTTKKKVEDQELVDFEISGFLESVAGEAKL